MTTTIKKLVIFGASGYGRELLDIGYDLGIREFKFLELNPTQTHYAGYEILNDTPETVKALADEGWGFAMGIGEPKLREKLISKHASLRFVNLIHPSVTFGYGMKDSVAEDTGVVITAGCRLTNSISIGRHVIVNLNCTIGHDTILGDFASLMPGVNISGNVDLQKGVYVGTGASIINGANDSFLKVGEHSIIGAGAVVTREIPAGVTAVGIPAKPLVRK